MKKISHILLIAMVGMSMLITACEKDEVPVNDTVYVLEDQMARPAINTVFVSSENKDQFNTTVPADMNSAFAAAFETRLLALNPGYTTNALGWDAPTFAGALATDVLNVDALKASAFGALNGRTLADDVIDTELTLIFGGPNGGANPGLTSDHVDANDKPFMNSFPYLARPW